MTELQGKVQWTDLVHQLLGELHQEGKTKQQIIEAIGTIPFSPAIITMFETIKAAGGDIIIVSDANTVYIDEILKAKNARQYITEIVSNPGTWGPDERLSVTRRVKPPAVHGCKGLLIADNPVIKGDNTTDFERNAADDYSETQSEGSSRSGGSVLSLHADRDPLHQDGAEGSESDLALKSEAEKNSKLNKDTQVLSEGEKEIMTFAEAGNERQRLIAMHHKKIIAELKQLHRSTVSQKAKEHRRKVSELLKDHEEEIEQLKLEQAANMKELVETQLQSQEVRADTAVSQNLLGMMLPAHIMEKMELGVQPEPEQFNCVTLFFTDIFEFKKLVGAIPPVKILHLLNELYTKFDEIIAKYPQLYKVETVSDTYMVAAGISSSHEKTDEEITECTVQALKCSMELQKLVQGLDLKNIVGNLPIKLRIGVHSGVINAGIIGTKMSRYCLFGDTVNTASRMCTTGEANRIQVSAQTIQVLGEDDSFEFEERGQIEVKGKGKMHTYWLLD
ncbi:Retinal guanylyl cyclase 2 [Rhizoclosmatium sp. JEL0117]|nr:Retinal guanylyl cyclase 2 [Rhizoclosmatium sp. JEL0117]